MSYVAYSINFFSKVNKKVIFFIVVDWVGFDTNIPHFEKSYLDDQRNFRCLSWIWYQHPFCYAYPT